MIKIIKNTLPVRAKNQKNKWIRAPYHEKVLHKMLTRRGRAGHPNNHHHHHHHWPSWLTLLSLSIFSPAKAPTSARSQSLQRDWPCTTWTTTTRWWTGTTRATSLTGSLLTSAWRSCAPSEWSRSWFFAVCHYILLNRQELFSGPSNDCFFTQPNPTVSQQSLRITARVSLQWRLLTQLNTTQCNSTQLM